MVRVRIPGTLFDIVAVATTATNLMATVVIIAFEPLKLIHMPYIRHGILFQEVTEALFGIT